MIELQQKAARVLSEFSGKTIAIGVSGGRDSMCLLHAVLHCGAVEKSNILCVHVNHRLRETAARDENFVREFCAANGVRFCAVSVDVQKECAIKDHTVEQAARNLRYEVFHDLIKRGDADVILTAHHALDNAESVLMHMFRGCGLDGLRGMSAITDSRVVRPFLTVYPDELDEYQKANGIEFVIDETNLSDDADRNFIRLNIIPLIRSRYGGAVRAVNALSAECAEVCELLNGELDMSNIIMDGGAVGVKQNALEGVLAARYVRRALEYFSVVDITREQTERVVELAHMRMGATVELTGGIIAAREKNGVAFYIPRQACFEQNPVRLGANFIDGLAVDIMPSDVQPLDAPGCCVDLDKIEGSVLRFRRDGDMFTPYGGKQKKLKQYFIDRKLPKRLRERTPLICRGNTVLVVVGVQISDAVKQDEHTVRKGVVKPRW